MRNQLIPVDFAIGGLTGRVYFAEGALDRSHTTVTAYNNSELGLTFGPMRLTLSVEAAAELAKHITQAVAATGDDQ